MTQSGLSIHLLPQIKSTFRQWNFYFSLSQPKYSNITKSSLTGQRLGKATDSHCSSVQFSSIAQSCQTLQLMDYSMPGFPVHHQLTELIQTHQWCVCQWCHPTSPSSVVPLSSHVQSFPASGSFPRSQFFASGGQSIGVSTSTSVLPMNTLDWSPLG